MQKSDKLEKIAGGYYDHLDLGSSTGNALIFGRDHLGLKRGIGLDIDPEKVRKATAAGHESAVLDVTMLGDYPNSVSAVTLFHFLEHLPSFGMARKCVQAAIVAAQDYVFIRQPWFDADTSLMRLGLKAYWSDWCGHLYHITAYEMLKMIDPVGGILDYRIYGRKRILSAADPALLPLMTPGNRHEYDANQDGAKPDIIIDFDAFYESAAIVRISDKVSYEALEATFKPELLFERRPARPKLESADSNLAETNTFDLA